MSATSTRRKTNKNKSTRLFLGKITVHDIHDVQLDFMQILNYDDDINDILANIHTSHVVQKIEKISTYHYHQIFLLFVISTYVLIKYNMNDTEYCIVTADGFSCIGEVGASMTFLVFIFLIILINVLSNYYQWFDTNQDENDTILLDPINICLPALLSDKNGFQLFAQHMIDEDSWEYLSFLVELLQIKYEYQLKNGQRLRLPFKRSSSSKAITMNNMNNMDIDIINDDKEYRIVEFGIESQTNDSIIHISSNLMVILMAPFNYPFVKKNTFLFLLSTTLNIVHVYVRTK